MTQEIWKDIEGYEGKYQVSNLGRVKSLNYNHTYKKKILRPSADKYGYLHINFYNNSKRKSYLIHRLVALTFIPNPNKLPEINHKDEDKTNNNVSNLEWCTREYNINYGTHNERVVKAHNGVYNTKASKVVLQYDKQGNFIKEYPSASEVERQLGYLQGNISNCCRGIYKSAYGFIWEYIN